MEMEDTVEDMDKGPIAYQESKIFSSEPYLISVYDNPTKRFCTFEVYSLDTQFVLSKMYPYAEFDNLFRFNAELMNPNRKDGRFHWCIERLEIATIGSETKLKLGAEPSEEVPQLPLYETNRKIPTGRMDLKERQRLREQMDMLDIRRAENISKKRAATRERFLKHIYHLKEEDLRRAREVEEKIALERAIRYKTKEEIEKKEEDQRLKLGEKAKIRRKAVDAKESLTEEQEEDVLRQVRARWKAFDEEKAKAISDAHARKVRKQQEDEKAAKELAASMAAAQAKREVYWKGRDDRAQKRNEDWLKRQVDGKAAVKRDAKMQRERNFEYVQDVHRDRQPIFEAQLQRTNERAAARAAEEEAAGNYKEERCIPKKTKKKGKHASKADKAGSDSPKKKHDKDDKKSPKKKDKVDKDHPKDKAEGKDGHGKKEDKDGKKDDHAKDKAHEKSSDKEGHGTDKSDKEGTAKKEGKEKDKDKVERALDAVEAKMRAEMEEERRRGALDRARTKRIDDIISVRNDKENEHNKTVRAAWRKDKAEEERLLEERRLVMRRRDEERRTSELRRKQEQERLQRAREANVARKEQQWLEKAHDGKVVANAGRTSPTAKR